MLCNCKYEQVTTAYIKVALNTYINELRVINITRYFSNSDSTSAWYNFFMWAKHIIIHLGDYLGAQDFFAQHAKCLNSMLNRYIMKKHMNLHIKYVAGT